MKVYLKDMHSQNQKVGRVLRTFCGCFPLCLLPPDSSTNPALCFSWSLRVLPWVWFALALSHPNDFLLSYLYVIPCLSPPKKANWSSSSTHTCQAEDCLPFGHTSQSEGFSAIWYKTCFLKPLLLEGQKGQLSLIGDMNQLVGYASNPASLWQREELQTLERVTVGECDRHLPPSLVGPLHHMKFLSQ